MFALTGLIYYYVMPVFGLNETSTGYFGLHIYSLDWLYAAEALYAGGAFAAFWFWRNILAINPAIRFPHDQQYSWRISLFFWALAAAGVITMLLLGYLNVFVTKDFELAADVSQYAFLNLAFSLMVPMMLVFMLHHNFKSFTWVLLLVVLFLFLQAGFRYRMVILLSAVATSFMLSRGYRMRASYVVASAFIMLPIINLIGAVRKYGNGINLEGIQDLKWVDLVTSFNGEIGIVYTLASFAQSPLPDPIGPEPWLVALARLIPSFIWHDKPEPTYLKTITAHLLDVSADQAGVAAPQHVEMMLQFGWTGIFFLSFLYMSIICLIVKLLSKLGWEGRIAGFSIIPAFFGFYMQTRGYFFQILADGLFYFLPLFLIYFRFKPRAGTSDASWV